MATNAQQLIDPRLLTAISNDRIDLVGQLCASVADLRKDLGHQVALLDKFRRDKVELDQTVKALSARIAKLEEAAHGGH